MLGSEALGLGLRGGLFLRAGAGKAASIFTSLSLAGGGT